MNRSAMQSVQIVPRTVQPAASPTFARYFAGPSTESSASTFAAHESMSFGRFQALFFALVLLLSLFACSTSTDSQSDLGAPMDLAWSDQNGPDESGDSVDSAASDSTPSDQHSTDLAAPSDTVIDNTPTLDSLWPDQIPDLPPDLVADQTLDLEPADTSSPTDTSPPTDADGTLQDADTADDAPDATAPETWSGSYTAGFGATLQGSGTGKVGAIQIAANSGTVVVQNQTVQMIATERIEWDTPQGHYTLIQLLGPTPQGFVVTYVYCLGAELNYVYAESFTMPMTGYPASGTCTLSAQPTLVQPSLPAMSTLPPPPSPLNTVDLQGPKVDITNGTGTLTLDQSYDVTMFGYVDCLTCPSADGNGWYEFHSILHDSFPSQVCFGILYFFPHSQALQLSWSFCFPDFVPLPSTLLSTASLSL